MLFLFIEKLSNILEKYHSNVFQEQRTSCFKRTHQDCWNNSTPLLTASKLFWQLQYFNKIFLEYFLNISVLCGIFEIFDLKCLFIRIFNTFSLLHLMIEFNIKNIVLFIQKFCTIF